MSVSGADNQRNKKTTFSHYKIPFLSIMPFLLFSEKKISENNISCAAGGDGMRKNELGLANSPGEKVLGRGETVNSGDHVTGVPGVTFSFLRSLHNGN